MFTMYALQEHVAKKLVKRLSNVISPSKAKVPPSKKPREDVEVSSDISTTDYNGDLSPRATTPLQSRDNSDKTCMYCIKHHFG